jgi:hypothetical protein
MKTSCGDPLAREVVAVERRLNVWRRAFGVGAPQKSIHLPHGPARPLRR